MKIKKLLPKKETLFRIVMIIAGIGLLLTTFLPIYMATL